MLNEFLDPKAVSFKEVSRSDVGEFVKMHYLGDYPSAAKIYLGIFYNGNMVGTLIYGSPIAPSIVRAIFKPEANVVVQNILELKRMFLVEDESILTKDARRNLAGYSISHCNDIVAEKFPQTKVIVSYSDPEHHTGAIYKATNAVYQGRASGKDRWVYPVGPPSQRKWVRANLKTNLDWKTTNESINLLTQLWVERKTL